MKQRNRSVFMVMVVLILVKGADLWARGGGAGGGHGGGGHGGGGGHSSGGFGGGGYYGGGHYSSGGTSSPAEVWFFLLLIVAFLAWKYYSTTYTSDESEDGRLYVNKGLPVDPALYTKVRTAFLTVQEAWMQKRPALMRRFITDGVYQRFNAQFTMMNLLGQTNNISNVTIHSIDRMPRPSEESGLYEVIDIRIEASADDQFVSTTSPELNSPGGRERFVEYWSFIRRKDGDHSKDIYNSNQCPKCSAPLSENMMKDARCTYCGSYINNGEFDWVLAEITQEGDYGTSAPTFNLPDVFRQPNSSFSVQVLEDKASNAFMQILVAGATGDAEAIRRFTTESGFEAVKKTWLGNRTIYDRLFLNSVMARQIDMNDGVLRAMVRIRFSYHPVNAPTMLGMATQEATLILVHRPVGEPSKGSIYANACPACGASQKDSLSHVCSYCRSNLNDITRDWIVTDITS